MKSRRQRALVILASIGAASSVLWISQAIAQQQHIRAYYRIGIVHPETKSVIYTILRGRVTVTKKETCNHQARKFAPRHIKQIERLKLHGAGGKLASIQLEEIRCKAD